MFQEQPGRISLGNGVCRRIWKGGFGEQIEAAKIFEKGKKGCNHQKDSTDNCLSRGVRWKKANTAVVGSTSDCVPGACRSVQPDQPLQVQGI